MPLARHDLHSWIMFPKALVSTHMPLARHDTAQPLGFGYTLTFLLTCLLRGMTAFLELLSNEQGFLLTCLLRGMTKSRRRWAYLESFYSHASCEAWHITAVPDYVSFSFYSHASCEAWLYPWYPFGQWGKFLLTCLLRGMTAAVYVRDSIGEVSTHMPLARHDQQPRGKGCAGKGVSTHMPLARHDGGKNDIYMIARFLLTCLLRGMTYTCKSGTTVWSFYSHASCEAWHVVSLMVAVSNGFLLTCLLRGMTRRLDI